MCSYFVHRALCPMVLCIYWCSVDGTEGNTKFDHQILICVCTWDDRKRADRAQQRTAYVFGIQYSALTEHTQFNRCIWQSANGRCVIWLYNNQLLFQHIQRWLPFVFGFNICGLWIGWWWMILLMLFLSTYLFFLFVFLLTFHSYYFTHSQFAIRKQCTLYSDPMHKLCYFCCNM